ncbi:MAG: hypothetical protein H5T59_08460 [Anaerolineae bacterium]|nr:hypothetical protein [Anaerolineae bacterium]
MGHLPRRSAWKGAALALLACLALAGWGLARADAPGPRLSRWTVAAVAWRGRTAQVAGQGSLGPSAPVGRSGARVSSVRLGFWAGLSPRLGATPTPTPAPSPTPTTTPQVPARRQFLPWATRGWP